MPTHPDHEPRYSSAEAAHAAGISMTTLRNWVSRKPQVILLTKEERERVGTGVPILYSVNRIIHMALTAELVGMHLPPRRAAMAAAAFTDTNRGEGDDPTTLKARQPGELFEEGFTYLMVPPGGEDDAINADVLNITEKTPAFMLLRLGITGYRQSEKAVILEVDNTVRRVRARLAELR